MRDRRWSRRLGASLGALMIAVVGVLGGVRPGAASSISGGGQLNATVNLSQFPCPFPTACGATTTTGGFRGSFTGTDVSGKAYTLTFPDPTVIPPLPPSNFTTSGLAFTDDCSLPPAVPEIADSGNADGSFDIANGLLTRGSVVSHGAVLQGGVHLARDGTNMTMGLSGMSVLTSSGGTTVATGLLGLGDVGFIVSVGDLTATCSRINFTSSSATIAGAVSSLA